MDLNDAPLPPAPLDHPVAVVAGKTLTTQLGDVNQVVGHAIPTRVLPGDIPSLEVEAEHVLAVAMYLRDTLGFDLLSSVSGVDLQERRQVVYHLRATKRNWLMQLKANVPATEEIDSVISVWPTANWLERETYDLFGITFIGHPDLRRILLDDEFEGWPLLKSFRPTPMTVHDRATTETNGERAVAGESQRGIGAQRAVPGHLSQGDQERLHPGTPTFGSTQFHGRQFPPQTWKHQPDYNGSGSNDPEADKK
jgi:NADH/F420H2 dehydrogenase subunit C